MRSVPVLLAVAVVVLAGCGGGNRAPRPSPGPTARPTASPRHAVHRPPAVRLGPDPRRGAAARAAAVPILMYHVITTPPAGTPYPELWVPARSFADQMRALHRAGYVAVTLERVLRAWRSGVALPRRPLVVSFDDGYASQYRNAFPVLRRLGWPGVLNLEVHNIGPGGIRESAVRALLAAGWEVDSHTLTHPDVTTLDAAALRHELVASRAVIRRRFGRDTAQLFCYPAGRFDARAQAAVRAAGYLAATTTQPGLATAQDDRFTLPRIRVDGTASAAAVLAAVRGSG